MRKPQAWIRTLPVFYCAVFKEENNAELFFAQPRQQRTVEFLRKTRWKLEGEQLSAEGVI